MKQVLKWALAIGWMGWLGLATAQELVKVPPLTGHVIDQISMLQPQQRAALEDSLTQYETRTGSQIALLLVSSTAPEAIEQYSIRVAEAWKLGRKNVDDGVILLVAKDNPKSLHRLRIEAGRGVQGSLTDLQSKRILQEIMAPYFQRSDFNGGLAAGVAAITTLLDKEQLPAPPVTTPSSADFPLGSLWPILLLMVIGIAVIAMRSRRGATTSGLDHDDWGRSAGVILGSALGNIISSGDGARGSAGESSGGISGGGGSFDGGGASGDW